MAVKKAKLVEIKWDANQAKAKKGERKYTMRIHISHQ